MKNYQRESSSELSQARYRVRLAIFDIPGKKEEVIRLEKEVAGPHFWQHQERAREAAGKIASLKEEVLLWDALTSDVQELHELVVIAGDDESVQRELEGKTSALERRFRDAEVSIFLAEKYDAGNATLSIYAGAGGQDAEDWAGILLRMYERYAQKRRWGVTELHRHENEHGGIKNATIEVSGRYAYGYLRREQGVHRLVRISPFSAKKLRHTSFAFVEILPDIKDISVIKVREEDIEYDFSRSSGKGGQNVNKRETAVRLTHMPTQISIRVESERSQAQNKEKALSILRAKLYQLREKFHREELDEIKGRKVSIEWGHQIRSYVLHPYQLVKDHRTEVETANVEGVLDGELDEFIEAELKL